jgi:hypothetical protein
MTGLRARARTARRTAIVTLSCSLALIAFSQSLAERAPAGKETLPPAVLALTLFLTALPALAVTQAVWGVVTEGLALVGSAAGVCFAVWWTREAWGQPARAGRPGGSPGDPWDPDRLARRSGPWSGRVLIVGAGDRDALRAAGGRARLRRGYWRVA